MESMEEVMPDTNEQALHYLINDADWDHQDVMDDIARDASRLIGGTPQSCLLIDETYFGKKGSHSAGVARQWNGRLGKTDNCQVGVFSALCRNTYCVPIDCDLYLPQSWIDDTKRLDKAKVPVDKRVFKTKTQLAVEQVDRALSNGVQFSWVAVDGGYGQCPYFHEKMREFGIIYVADVHKNQAVYLEQTRPQARGRKGRLKVEAESVRLDRWLEQSEDIPWEIVSVRDGVKGPIRVRCKRFEAFIWNEPDQSPHVHHVTVLITQMPDGSDTKFAITNADASTPTWQLAYYQRQRFWVEQSFRDGKGEVGLHEYQVRSWHGWHRHMTLCFVALLYMLELKLTTQDDLPLLSAHDARDILAAEFLGICVGVKPHDDLARILEARHRRRHADICNSYARKDLPVPDHYRPKVTK